MTMTPPKLDVARLSQFKYAIINLVEDDGFPLSLPTDFELTPRKEILLKKPATHYSLNGRHVGVLFNHITAIPTGGYMDRRYVLVWGKLAEQNGRLRLDPESVSEWDEKILPFDQLCSRAAPQAQKYLETLQHQIEA